MLLLLVISFLLVINNATHAQQIDLDCQSKVDIVLAVDGSGSILPADWLQIKNFTQTLVARFNVQRDRVHVGVVQFSGAIGSKIEIPLSFDKQNVLSTLENMNQGGGGTPIDEGLNAAGNMLSSHIEERKDSNKIVILLTDGDHTGTPGAEFVAADQLKKDGVLVFCIGVRDTTSKDSMQRMASSPAANYVYPVSNFDLLNGLIGQLVQETCIEVHSLTPNFACLGQDTVVDITGRGFKNVTDGALTCRFGDRTDIYIQAEFLSRTQMRCVLPATRVGNASNIEEGQTFFVEISVNGNTFTQSRREFQFLSCGSGLSGADVAAIVLATMAAACCCPWLLLLLLLLLLLCCLCLCALLGLLAPALVAKPAPKPQVVIPPVGGVPLLPVPPPVAGAKDNDRGYFLVAGRPVFIDYGKGGTRGVRNVHSMRMGDRFGFLGGNNPTAKVKGDEYAKFEDVYEDDDEPVQTSAKKKKAFCAIL